MIKLHNISKSYDGGTTALHPTSLHFAKGEFAVLLGPSGAGKSTFLRCINLLNKPTTGRIEVGELGTLNGKRKLIRRHRRDTAMIFQQHQLINRWTALSNVLVGRIGYHNFLRTLVPLPYREKELALECLERVGLSRKAMERVDNLSGGEQQRVGIARGLAQKPRILLADEPVASLDPATSRKVLSQLYDICKEKGLTAIVSLHQVELALDYADRIIGLSSGRIVFDGQAKDVTEEILDVIYNKSHSHPRKTETADSFGIAGELAYKPI